MDEILFNIKKEEISKDKIYSSVDDKIIEYKRIKEGERIDGKNHYFNYNNVKQQIDDVVKVIKEKVNMFGPFKWEENWQETEYKETFNKIKDRKKLLCSDLIGFRRVQVTNDIFHKNWSKGYLQFGKSFFEISQNSYLWFPHLTPNKEWRNTVEDDWNIIREQYIGNDVEIIKSEAVPKRVENLKRYTFAKYKNTLGEISYRFIGVFKFKKRSRSNNFYEKISDEITL